MKLPSHFVNKYFEDGSDCNMYGVSVKDMEKEQLIACIGFLTNQEENNRKEHSRQLNFMKHIKKR